MLLHWSVGYHLCCTTATKGGVVAYIGCAHDGVGVDITVKLRVTATGGVMREGRDTEEGEATSPSSSDW